MRTPSRVWIGVAVWAGLAAACDARDRSGGPRAAAATCVADGEVAYDLDDDCDGATEDAPGVPAGAPNAAILSTQDSSWCWYSRVTGQVSDPDEPPGALTVRWRWRLDGRWYGAEAQVGDTGETGFDVPEDAFVRLVVTDSDGNETAAAIDQLDGLDCS